MGTSEENLNKRPNNWAETKLEHIAKWGTGGTPSRRKPEYFGGNLPWIKTGELGEKFVNGAQETITEEGLKSCNAKLYPAGSVVVALYGATIGKTSILGIDTTTNQACAVAQPSADVIFNQFLYYYLYCKKRDFIHLGKGGAQPNISQGILRDFPICLPPLPEQHRIVAKIEELFSELDNSVANLKKAQEQLKVYRQAVLKHAFEGKLTAKWREENKDQLESVDVLLERIKKERTERYEQQVVEWKKAVEVWEAAGKEGKKQGRPKAKPEIAYDADILPSTLPKEWLVLTSKEACDIEDGDRGKEYPRKVDFSEKGYCLFLNAKNVTKMGFKFDVLSFISKEKHEAMRKGTLKREDLIFTSRGTLGNIAYYGEDVNYKHVRINSGMFILRGYEFLLQPQFFMYFLMSPFVTSQIAKLKSGTAQPQLPIREFHLFEIHIPSKCEQAAIVDELERHMSSIEVMEAEVRNSIRQSESLRQSILKAAFEGKLVSQDPNDEPANILLERIKAEKAKTNGTSIRKTKSKGKKE